MASGWIEQVFPNDDFSNLRSIWGFSASQIYGVGDGIVASWNGSQMAQVVSGAENGDVYGLASVWGASAAKLWAVSSSTLGVCYSIDQGATWTAAAAQPAGSANAAVVFGFSATDVWVGGTGYISHTTDGGATWTDYALAAPALNCNTIFGTAANNVYFGTNATSSGQAIISKWDGATLSTVQTRAYGYSSVLCIWGTSATDIYVVAFAVGASNPQKILHSTDGCSTFDIETIAPAMASTFSLAGISGGGSKVYATTYQTALPTQYILERNGGSWDWAADQNFADNLQGTYPNQMWVNPATGLVVAGTAVYTADTGDAINAVYIPSRGSKPVLTNGADLAWATNPATGKLDFKWDTAGSNPQFTDDNVHRVLSLLVEHRASKDGPGWVWDAEGSRGSLIYTVKNIRRSTPSQLEAYARDALQKAVNEGWISNVKVEARLGNNRQPKIGVTWTNPDKSQQSVALPLGN